jgi:hypothetical protein
MKSTGWELFITATIKQLVMVGAALALPNQGAASSAPTSWVVMFNCLSIRGAKAPIPPMGKAMGGITQC